MASSDKIVRNWELTANDYKAFEDLRSHIYAITDTYAGSDKQMKRVSRLYDLAGQKFVETEIMLPEVLERCAIEMISNVGDNANRSRKAKLDPGRIDVWMTRTALSVRNEGTPIPIELWKGSDVYVPQQLFGRLHVSSEYDSNIARTGGGRNGYGVKIVNIFSEQFDIDVGDATRKKHYVQSWSQNMKQCHAAKIASYSGRSYVKVTSQPDLKRFGYTEYPDEAFYLIARHVADLCFTSKLQGTFHYSVNENQWNKVDFDFTDPLKYAQLYFGDCQSLLHVQYPDNVECPKEKVRGKNKDSFLMPEIELVILDTPDNGQFVSFVNGIPTPNGGVHVDAVYKALSGPLLERVNASLKKVQDSESKSPKGKGKTKNKGGEDKPKSRPVQLTLADVKAHVSILLNCRVLDPTFDSQSKLTLKSPSLNVNFKDNFFDGVERWQLLHRLYAALEAKKMNKLKKTDAKKAMTHNDKHYPANWAKSKDPEKKKKCVLFIVEGDGAKEHPEGMMAQMENSRDWIGLFTLRGKVLNVTNASIEDLVKNKELMWLKDALGLREGKDYKDPANFATLNYGAVYLLTDADDDGIHIRGLLFNYLNRYYPSLLEIGYAKIFRTPVVVARKGAEIVKRCYSFASFQEFIRENPDLVKTLDFDYLKGLGSSESIHIKDDQKQWRTVDCKFDATTPGWFDLSFNKDKISYRKQLISQWNRTINIEELRAISLSQFCSQELIQYSVMTLRRALPYFMDGLKESQRKLIEFIMLYCKQFSDSAKAKKELIGFYTAGTRQHLKYHHGEAALDETYISMCQDYTGANNLPYGTCDGQFGSRHNGGKSAPARYIKSRPMWHLPLIYKKEDRVLLNFLYDEGDQIEPAFFLPILPMQLINGCAGIATGYSTYIPAHNPRDIVDWFKRRLEGRPTQEIKPWYRGFQGEIYLETREEERVVMMDMGADEKKEVIRPRRLAMVSRGIFRVVKDVIYITELPVGRWTQKYEKILKDWETNGIIDYYITQSNTKGHEIYFELHGFKGPEPKPDGWKLNQVTHKDLKLQKACGLQNMVLLDNEGRPRKYHTVREILEEFYRLRLPYYEKRKESIIKTKQEELEKLSEKKRFLEALHAKKIRVDNPNGERRSKTEMYQEMDELKLDRKLLDGAKYVGNTKEGIAQLEQKIQAKLKEIEQVKLMSAERMWYQDLEEFETKYNKNYKD